MAERDIRKMGKNELADLVAERGKEIEELRRRLDEAQTQVVSRRVQLDRVGSIAEASLQLNKVFESAQAAADQYLDNIKEIKEKQEAESERLLTECRTKAENLLTDAGQKSKSLIEEAQLKSNQILADAEEKANHMVTDAQGKSDKMLSDAADRVNEAEKKSEGVNADAKNHSETMIDEAKSKAKQLLEEAVLKARSIEQETDLKCQKQVAEAKEKSQEYWDAVRAKLEAMIASQDGLKEMLGRMYPNGQ